jgi:hypothetical protein
MEGHEFEIVVVRPDAEMGDALEAFGSGNLVWHEEPARESGSLDGGFSRHGFFGSDSTGLGDGYAFGLPQFDEDLRFGAFHSVPNL